MNEPIFSSLTGKNPTAATASGACCNINGNFTLDSVVSSQNMPDGSPVYKKIENGQLVASISYNPFAGRWEIQSLDTDGFQIRYISNNPYNSPPQQGWELINGGVDYNVIINLS